MQATWKGHYHDGRTARRHDAAVTVTPAGIEIKTEGQVGSIFWPFEEITQTQGFYDGEPIRLERAGGSAEDPAEDHAEVLVVTETEFLQALRELAPAHSSSFHDPELRKGLLFRVVVGTIATIALVAAVYLWGIPAAANMAAERVPPAWEDKLGEAVAEGFVEDLKLCDAQPVEESINGIVRALDAAAPSHPYTFKVRVLKNPMVNALAAPGGHIIIFTGLLEATETPEELAGVLAHEMQHVIRRHSTKSIFQTLSTYVLLSLVFGDVSGVAETVHTLGNLRYSRAHEEEADRLGMSLLLGARIDPSGMIRFFDTMKEREGDLPEAFKYITTHPLTAERIESLKALSGEADYLPLLPEVKWDEVAKACGSGGGSKRQKGRTRKRTRP